MDRRQMMAAGVATLGVASVGYALFAPLSDEELIIQVLDDLGVALSFSKPIGNPVFHGSHLSEQFEELFTEQIQIRVSEVRASIPSHRGKLGLATARVLSRYGSLDVSFSVDKLTIDESSADVMCTATVLGTLGGEPKRDTRPVQMTLVKDSGDWKIQLAIVRSAQ